MTKDYLGALTSRVLLLMSMIFSGLVTSAGYAQARAVLLSGANLRLVKVAVFEVKEN